MPFHEDAAVAEAVGPVYGKYQTTFRSDGGQVYAHVCEQRGRLVAHVAFAPGVKPAHATDGYHAELHQYALDHGYADQLRLVYADR